jgi:hypothetical protein
MIELVLRFVIGGLVVSAFAVLGDALKPRTFAGIFAAAPSVALASLGMTHAAHGPDYVSDEGRSMIAGAIALLVYAALSREVVKREIGPPWLATASLWVVWLGVAGALWWSVLRS